MFYYICVKNGVTIELKITLENRLATYFTHTLSIVDCPQKIMIVQMPAQRYIQVIGLIQPNGKYFGEYIYKLDSVNTEIPDVSW